MQTWKFILCLLALTAISASQARADFTIDINYTDGDAQFEQEFEDAKLIWEGLLSGYQDGLVVGSSSGSSYSNGDTVDTLFINASVVPIDGAGNVLGQAGPTAVATDQTGFVLATNGNMQFDSADFANLSANNRAAVILHEMGHVMGFGTLFDNNGLYVNGSGEFTGINATQAWQNEFGQSGTPDIELAGGPGTANAHWNEVDGGAGLTGITDGDGNDMRNELMTGWLNSNYFISDMTIGSFQDIGFTATAVPEPGSATLLAMVSIGLIVKRRRS